MVSTVSREVREVYQKLLDGWNNKNARAIADLYSKDGVNIALDGIQSNGPKELYSHLKNVFEDQIIPPFVSKVKDVQFLSTNIAILRAIAGMVVPGQSDIHPKGITYHTLVMVKNEGKWFIINCQSTPARLDSRPELLEQLIAELRN